MTNTAEIRQLATQVAQSLGKLQALPGDVDALVARIPDLEARFPGVGGAAPRGLSPANALDRLRAELRYWVELCPCSGVDDDFVQLNVER